MSTEKVLGITVGKRVTIVRKYFGRLLSPPLPGDGLLFVGAIEGVIGWSVSWLLVSNPSLAPFGLVESIVLLWVVLTAGIVAIGVRYTAPTVRRNRIWLVWAGLNASATVINVAAIAGWLPGLVEGLPLSSELVGLGYWRPWFLAIGIGYVATALYDWDNPQLRRGERLVYGLSGVGALSVLLGWPVELGLFGAELFVVGGLLHVLPMGFDVFADVALILRRS
jgi:hypothetical protein